MATSNRRRLFVRSQPEHPLTPLKVRVLGVVGELELATVPQLSGFLDLSERAVRSHTSDLFHMGYLHRIGVPRAALAAPGCANDPSLLFGWAPTIHTLTRAGAKFLGQPYQPCPYGPLNSLFLAHELAIRDVRVWLERLSRRYGHQVTHWQTGLLIGPARPDAVFVYTLPTVRLVGLVEVDRATEHSPKRWQDKHRAYLRALQSDALQQAVGHARGRVIVITPDAKRRDAIAAILAGRGLEDRFWLSEASSLERADLSAAVWRVPGSEALLPLVPPHLFTAEGVHHGP